MKKSHKLKGFILEKALLCLHEPEDKFKYPFVTPSFAVQPGADDQAVVPARSLSGHYLQMYDWDACFFSQASRQIGKSDLIISIIDNFISFQNGDGHIPRTISPHRIWDGYDLCKPFLIQTFVNGLTKEETYPISNEVLKTYVQHFTNYLVYFEKNRLNNGLYHWRNVLESGVDNNLSLLAPQEAAIDENYAVGCFLDTGLLACDLNSYLVREFSAFAQLASLCDLDDLAKQYEKRASDLIENIENQLWNEKLGLYCNLDPASGKQIPIRSWTGLVPALLDIASPERRQQVIEQNILNADHFFRPSGLASLAASELLYNQAKRGLYGAVIVSNWQGPMWILPNALTVRCLLKHSYQKEAEEISQRVIKTMAAGLDQRGTLFENYSAETGETLWAPDFMSWNILALELIEVLE